MPQKKLIFADYFTSLHTREFSGQAWSWRYYHGDNVQWSGDLYESEHSPRKETASPFYPLINPYDTLDPDVLEYHILLAKTAGIDGFLCEYDTHHSLDHQVVLQMAQIAKQHDFKIGIHWIPINFTNRTPQLDDRVQMLESAKDCLHQLFTNVYDVAGIHIDERPLVLFFGVRASDYLPTIVKDTFFSGSEIDALRETFKKRNPMFLAPHYQSELINHMDGFYPWILPFGAKIPPNSLYDKIGDQAAQQEHLHHFYSHTQKMCQTHSKKYFMGGVWPGFDDHKGRAWGENIARFVPRDNGEMLALTWKMCQDANAERVLHITWNDWIESTIIEPSLELGYTELAATHKQIALWKQTPYTPERLAKPKLLFDARKQTHILKLAGCPSKTIHSATQHLDKAAHALNRSDSNQFNKYIKLFHRQLSTTDLSSHHFLFDWSLENPDSDFVFSKDNQTILFQFHKKHHATIPKGYWQGRIALTFHDEGTQFVSIQQGIPSSISPNLEIANFKLTNTKKTKTIALDLIHRHLANDPTQTRFIIDSAQLLSCTHFSLSLTLHEHSNSI